MYESASKNSWTLKVLLPPLCKNAIVESSTLLIVLMLLAVYPSDKKRRSTVYAVINTELSDNPGGGTFLAAPLFLQTRYLKNDIKTDPDGCVILDFGTRDDPESANKGSTVDGAKSSKH